MSREPLRERWDRETLSRPERDIEVSPLFYWWLLRASSLYGPFSDAEYMRRERLVGVSLYTPRLNEIIAALVVAPFVALRRRGYICPGRGGGAGNGCCLNRGGSTWGSRLRVASPGFGRDLVSGAITRRGARASSGDESSRSSGGGGGGGGSRYYYDCSRGSR